MTNGHQLMMGSTSPRNLLLRSLVTLGQHASPQLARGLNGAANFIEAGRMLHEAGIDVQRPSRTRFDVFEIALTHARQAEWPVYLEFGVWRGETIAFWAARLENPVARFIGFDSFHGLPESWTAGARRGSFSTLGKPPTPGDKRVSFCQGWFAATVPYFSIPEHDLLILNIDSDLYSSAKTVLDALGHTLCIGDLLYFDEFHDRLHESLAFHEFCQTTGYRFEMLATTPGLTNVLFRRVA